MSINPELKTKAEDAAIYLLQGYQTHDGRFLLVGPALAQVAYLRDHKDEKWSSEVLFARDLDEWLNVYSGRTATNLLTESFHAHKSWKPPASVPSTADLEPRIVWVEGTDQALRLFVPKDTTEDGLVAMLRMAGKFKAGARWSWARTKDDGTWSGSSIVYRRFPGETVVPVAPKSRYHVKGVFVSDVWKPGFPFYSSSTDGAVLRADLGREVESRWKVKPASVSLAADDTTSKLLAGPGVYVIGFPTYGA